VDLTVRPDDLSTSAAALRRVHDNLARACADFSSVALRLVPDLGPHAVETARTTVMASGHACESVMDDLATFAQGLTAAAAYYSAIDRHALGRVSR
jgi:Excreted virulence factor EspC, type VII ESX diderm